MNLGKIVTDPGHIHGANKSPNYPNYSEGTEMFNLAQLLNKIFGWGITRGDYERPTLPERVSRAVSLKANTLISLHTNWPTYGCIVYYSVKRPEDKPIAELIAYLVSKALGVKNRGAETKTQSDGQDWYGIIRSGVNKGLDHVFLVEHCQHDELAKDTEEKLNKIVESYGGVLMSLLKGCKGEEVKTLQTNLNKLINAGLTVDGSYGPATETAVKAFQAKYSLAVDGKAGPETLGKMDELLHAPAPAPVPSPDEKDCRIKELEAGNALLRGQLDAVVLERDKYKLAAEKAEESAKVNEDKIKAIKQAYFNFKNELEVK